jgi:hypothetical protein
VNGLHLREVEPKPTRVAAGTRQNTTDCFDSRVAGSAKPTSLTIFFALLTGIPTSASNRGGWLQWRRTGGTARDQHLTLLKQYWDTYKCARPVAVPGPPSRQSSRPGSPQPPPEPLSFEIPDEQPVVPTFGGSTVVTWDRQPGRKRIDTQKAQDYICCELSLVECGANGSCQAQRPRNRGPVHEVRYAAEPLWPNLRPALTRSLPTFEP